MLRGIPAIECWGSLPLPPRPTSKTTYCRYTPVCRCIIYIYIYIYTDIDTDTDIDISMYTPLCNSDVDEPPIAFELRELMDIARSFRVSWSGCRMPCLERIQALRKTGTNSNFSRLRLSKTTRATSKMPEAGGDPIEHAWNAWLTAHPAKSSARRQSGVCTSICRRAVPGTS